MPSPELQENQSQLRDPTICSPAASHITLTLTTTGDAPRLMLTCFASWSKLPTRSLLRQWLTTRAPVARQLATRSAKGQTAIAETLPGEVDAFSTAAVRIRKEILGVRNLSMYLLRLEVRFSN